MKKKIAIIIVFFVIIIGIYGVFHFNDKNDEIDNITGENNSENQIANINLEELINKVYSNIPEGTLPNFQTMKVELNDLDIVTYDTGLTSVDKIDEIYKSEPMMSSQAYSFILVKTKTAEDAEKIQEEMVNNIDPRKWICVCAEKIYSISKDNIVALVMSNEEWGKPVFESIKKEIGEGKELQKTVEENVEQPIDTVQ